MDFGTDIPKRCVTLFLTLSVYINWRVSKAEHSRGVIRGVKFLRVFTHCKLMQSFSHYPNIIHVWNSEEAMKADYQAGLCIMDYFIHWSRSSMEGKESGS